MAVYYVNEYWKLINYRYYGFASVTGVGYIVGVYYKINIFIL